MELFSTGGYLPILNTKTSSCLEPPWSLSSKDVFFHSDWAIQPEESGPAEKVSVNFEPSENYSLDHGQALVS